MLYNNDDGCCLITNWRDRLASYSLNPRIVSLDKRAGAIPMLYNIFWTLSNVITSFKILVLRNV